MSEYDRHVYFCHFEMYDTVKNYKDVNNLPVKINSKLDLNDFYGFIKLAFDNSEAFKLFDSDKKELRIQDMSESDDSYLFLINYTEADGSHHVSRNIANGNRNEKQYEPTEGPENSAHVVIYKNRENRSHVMLIEKISGFPITKAIVFFNAVLKAAMRVAKGNIKGIKGAANPFSHDHPLSETDNKGKVKKVIYTPHVSIDAMINPSFFDALSRGTISDIELISDKPRSAGMDFPDNFKSWIVKIDKKPAEDSISDYVTRLLSQGKDFEMDRLKIKFKDEHDMPKTQNFDLDGSQGHSSGFLGDNCVLIKKMTLQSRPYASYENVDEVIVSKMKELV